MQWLICGIKFNWNSFAESLGEMKQNSKLF